MYLTLSQVTTLKKTSARCVEVATTMTLRRGRKGGLAVIVLAVSGGFITGVQGTNGSPVNVALSSAMPASNQPHLQVAFIFTSTSS